jgi:histidinol phosphatase-like enzyme
MEIIVPAAGLSTRFPGMKPKYLLFDYKGDLMLKNALYPYLGVFNITIGILKEHDDEFHAKEYIESELNGMVNVVILNERTKGPADTVYQILELAGIEDDKEILIKDCDSFFKHDYSSGNYICVSNIAEHKVLKKLSSKSFVISNDQGIITNIIEKDVVSDTFCVGAYKFESVKLFKDTFVKLSKNIPEVYVSHVIQDCLMENHIFIRKPVTDYTDVGTAEDWFEFNDKPTIFCDIDGTIVKAQGRYGENSYDNEPVILHENVKRLKELKESGAQIIFTTSRPLYAEEQTKTLLDKLGFSDCAFLIGLNVSRRIVINDYNNANPYPRAEAINIKRDSDNLKDFL